MVPSSGGTDPLDIPGRSAALVFGADDFFFFLPTPLLSTPSSSFEFFILNFTSHN